MRLKLTAITRGPVASATLALALFLLWSAGRGAIAQDPARLVAVSAPQGDEQLIASGREIYSDYCRQCHQPSGLGVPGRFPPLIGSTWVTGPPEITIRIVLNGLEGPVEVQGQRFNGAMPAFRIQLSDQDIAAVLTYIRRRRLSAASAVAPATVRAIRAATATRRRPWTASELGAGRGNWLVVFVSLAAIAAALLALRISTRRRAP